MKKSMKTFFLGAIFLLLISGVQAQVKTADLANGKIVKWEAVSGKNDEFIFHIPTEYITSVDGNYYKGGKANVGVKIDKELKFARYINGSVLMMEYYEGEAKKIQMKLEELEKIVPVKTEEINGFQVKSFSEKKDKQFCRTQHFQIKNRLYVAKSISFSENDEVTKVFFNSIRLLNGNVSNSPNLSNDTKSIPAPVLIEQDVQMLEDSNAIVETQTDRKVIVLKIFRPKFPMNSLRSKSSGRLKIKILYSSSGKITNVEVIESPSKELEKIAIESAKNTIFIPAEKEGKLVSVYKTQEYSFGINTEIRRF